jgi:signal transduction histidine kinase
MSDIVWAINPRRDHLGDLAHRMRRFASDVLVGVGADLELRTPVERADALLGADVRREVFLIFKESINNAARHSGCKHVEVHLKLEGSRLLLSVQDDGRGFASQAEGQGHGLASMRERARRLGGHLETASEAGQGTIVRLAVPLSHHGRVKW